MKLQVDKSHYEFSSYVTRQRWASIWCQLNEVINLSPKSVLEVGPGSGVFTAVGSNFGLSITTLDIDSKLNPSCVASITEELPFRNGAFDVVCAFQVLEHLPFEESMLALKRLAVSARRFVVLSLPDSRPIWRYWVHIPVLGGRSMHVPRPFWQPSNHSFDGEHYWEINKKGFELSYVVNRIEDIAPVIKTFRVMDNPYHRFFILDCR